MTVKLATEQSASQFYPYGIYFNIGLESVEERVDATIVAQTLEDLWWDKTVH